MPKPLIFQPGDTVGNNIIIEKDIELTKEKHRGYWKCKCIGCGKIRSVRVDNLKAKCRYCATKDRPIGYRVQDNFIGQHFGLWTVNGKSPKKNYWTCKCQCGTIKDVFRGNLTQGNSKSCGCVSSWGEKQIVYWLNFYNIQYKKEVSFKDFQTDKGGYPRFDFILYKNNEIFCIIEYDGRQHKSYDKNWKMTENDFKRLQYIDNLKNEYCKIHNISLFRFNPKSNLEKELKQISININSK